MTVLGAIEMLKQAKNVHEWNKIRDDIKLQLTTEEWFKTYHLVIDASGLIVEVLKSDNNDNIHTISDETV